MKRITIMAAIALLAISTMHAQPKQGNWQEKIMSEKIAFITMELELTPEEAQVFWPVYNQIAKENQKLQKAMMTAYRTMKQALAEGTASDKDLDKMLDEYLAAKQAHKESGKGDVEKYRKVLPSKKVVKLYIAEENFRRHHINNMKGNHQGPSNGPARPAGQTGKPGPRK